MAIKTYVINSKKASSLWGGVHIGYVVNMKEVNDVKDEIYGDMLIKVLHNTIEEIHTLDMCVCGKMKCRETAHCIGEICDFCGKFTEMYNE